MTNREMMVCLYRNLEDLAEHLMQRFGIPNDRSLVDALNQPGQRDNRTALICWIGAEMLDPEIDDEADLVAALLPRLARLLVDENPHRWAELLGHVVREERLPDLSYLQALRGRQMGVYA